MADPSTTCLTGSALGCQGLGCQGLFTNLPPGVRALGPRAQSKPARAPFQRPTARSHPDAGTKCKYLAEAIKDSVESC